MIVWIASFPRSGNTFLRMLLNQRYGIRSDVIYDADGVADRLGADVVGYTQRTLSLEALRADAKAHFIKTHRTAIHDAAEGDAAIYLVRDGRDALVSWARQRSEGSPELYDRVLEDAISNASSTGTWGANVRSWMAFAGDQAVPFTALVREPDKVVDAFVQRVCPGREPVGLTVPVFAELHHNDPLFFRRGLVGSFRDEMPAHLERRFWDVDDNRAAMDLLHALESPIDGAPLPTCQQ